MHNASVQMGLSVSLGYFLKYSHEICKRSKKDLRKIHRPSYYLYLEHSWLKVRGSGGGGWPMRF